MSQNRARMKLGIILIAAGLLSLTVSSMFFTTWGYPIWPMGHMMGRLNAGEVRELSGTVKKIEWMEIEVDVEGEEVEVHGPSWFWQAIGIKVGDTIIAEGGSVSMMEPGEGWHEAFVPFELMVDGETFGSVNEGMPVWMQG